jgi:hypothetical protein
MIKKPRLNNIQLAYKRNDLIYEAVMTDLYLMGLIPKNVVEAFTGREVSEQIKMPAEATKLNTVAEE